MVRWMSNEYFFYNCSLLLKTNLSVSPTRLTFLYMGIQFFMLVARILLASLSSACIHESQRCGRLQSCCVYGQESFDIGRGKTKIEYSTTYMQANRTQVCLASSFWECIFRGGCSSAKGKATLRLQQLEQRGLNAKGRGQHQASLCSTIVPSLSVKWEL